MIITIQDHSQNTQHKIHIMGLTESAHCTLNTMDNYLHALWPLPTDATFLETSNHYTVCIPWLQHYIIPFCMCTL